MLIFPAIDIINGECVRLRRGNYNEKKTYCKNPVKVALNFQKLGATFLHVVDLDGAKLGKPINLLQIKKIRDKTCLSMQVGGGIRNFKDAETILKMGIDRIILGTSAATNRPLLLKLLKKYGPQKIIVSIDAKDEKVLVEGWLKGCGKNLPEFINDLKTVGIRTIIYTDINSDGMLKGPNFKAIKSVIATGLDVIVAGGVSNFTDLQTLKKLGACGAIIGKALYEEKINLGNAVQKIQKNNLAKRIIPCMDVQNGRVVKGTFFKNLKDAGDPVLLAKQYSNLGADELVFLDITATIERRKTICDFVRRISKNIDIPFTVGGGISSLTDIRNLLKSGADKVSIGSFATTNPKFIKQASEAFGSQCIVVSVDAKKYQSSWKIFINGGRTNTGLDAIEFAKNMAALGAGELLVNSLDRDGTKTGYDLMLLKKITEAVNIPVIASSGAGKESDFLRAFKEANVDAVLAASVFHYGQILLPDLKKYLLTNQLTIRI